MVSIQENKNKKFNMADSTFSLYSFAFRFKDGTEITERTDSRVKFQRDGNAYIMIITGAVRTDAARYSCELKNEHGKTNEETRVRIKCSPDFKTKLKNITCTEGDTNVELFVAIQGYPKYVHNHLRIRCTSHFYFDILKSLFDP